MLLTFYLQYIYLCLCVHLYVKSVNGFARLSSCMLYVCKQCMYSAQLFPLRHTNCTMCCFSCVFSVGLIKWIMHHSWRLRWQPLLFWQILHWVSRSNVCLQPLLLLSVVTATCCVTCWILLDGESHRSYFTWALFQWITYSSNKQWLTLKQWAHLGTFC